MERTCKKCGKTKPLEEFPRRIDRYKDKIYPRYRWECKECESQYKHQYWEANKDAKRAYSTKYWKTHREGLLERQRKYRQAHLEQLRLYDREYYWKNRKTILPKQRERGQKRRREQRLKVLEIYGAKCKNCGYSEHPEILQIDHIEPLFRKTNKLGHFSVWKHFNLILEHPENYQLLCPNCHAIKTRGDLEKWLSVQNVVPTKS